MARLNYVLMFLIGFFSCGLIFIVYFGFVGITGLVVSDENFQLNTPSDWISKDNIFVFDDEVVIKINNATLSGYEATGSMEPVLDEESTGIRIVPSDESQINIGDIISFRQDGKASELIVHRVIEKAYDDEGIYFITKGDNSDFVDGKIRFEDIKYVTVGVIW